jgi:hypothetical protein
MTFLHRCFAHFVRSVIMTTKIVTTWYVSIGPVKRPVGVTFSLLIWPMLVHHINHQVDLIFACALPRPSCSDSRTLQLCAYNGIMQYRKISADVHEYHRTCQPQYSRPPCIATAFRLVHALPSTRSLTASTKMGIVKASPARSILG